MKNTNFLSAVVTAASLACAMAPAMANASDGTITFTGSVTASTCTIAVNGGAASATVVLPPVSTKSLTGKGVVAGATNFSIALSACEASLKNANAFFELGATVNTATANLVNSGTATLVEVQLLDKKGTHIKPGDQAQYAAGSYTPVTSAAATLSYAAQYYATGQTTAGTVSSTVTYSISYL